MTKLDIGDRGVSYLRTAVPVIWGSIIATVLRLVSPHLPTDVGTALAGWLGSELALTLVTAIVIAAWYWVWRRLEPRIPDWLIRLALGSARPPVYALPGAEHIELTRDEQSLIRDLRLTKGRDEHTG